MGEQDDHPTPEELGRLPLFGALPPGALEFLAERLTIRSAVKGEFVCEQGATRSDVNVLLSGEAEVLKLVPGGDPVSVATLGPGEGIGVMSLVDIQPQHDSVRLTSDARLLRMTGADLDALYRHDLKAYSMFVLNLARDVSRRLREAEDTIASLAGSG
jgi:CRP-like cAMP-binding protein